MNLRILRNGMLTLGLCAIATLIPTHESEAQAVCQTQACQDCVQQVSSLGWGCVAQCVQLGLGEQCPYICQNWINQTIAQYCYPLG
jgi:hypothetical protein